jgi:hypothetical protein
MDQPQFGSLWDTVRAWADSAGLLRPQDPSGQRPPVPQSVCDNCPICQSAATLDQVNPDVIAELSDVARGLLAGVGSALATAAEQRLGSQEASDIVPGEPAREAPEEAEAPEHPEALEDPRAPKAPEETESREEADTSDDA